MLLTIPHALLSLTLLSGCTDDLSVVDDAGLPVEGAEVFVDCALVGTTDANGMIALRAEPGASIAVRKRIETGETPKALHDGWSWRAYATNVVQRDDGSQRDDAVSASGDLPRVVVSEDNTMIGLHFVGISDIDTSAAVADSILDSWALASPYLLDVTDGQMYIERFDLYEEALDADDADFWYGVDLWPGGGSPMGPAQFVQRGSRMYLPVQGFSGWDYTFGSWTTQNGFRTLVHETGHFLFDAHDEYVFDIGGEVVDASCPDPAPSGGAPGDASMMWSQYDTSEMCSDEVHSSKTRHELYAHDSVWGHFEAVWEAAGLQIKTPMERGAVNPGPEQLHCMASYTGVAHIDTSPVCDQLFLTATLPDGSPGANMLVALEHGGRSIAEGRTDAEGRASVVGAAAGDSVTLQGSRVSASRIEFISGSAVVDDTCTATIALETYSDIIPVIPKPDLDLDGGIFRVVIADPLDAFGGIRVWIGQGGPNIDPIPVSRAASGERVAEIAIDPERPLDFRVSTLLEDRVVQRFDTRFQAARLDPPARKDAAPSLWSPLGVDGPGVHIPADTLPAGVTAVLGRTVEEVPAPEGTLFVGGPWALSLSEDVLVPFSAPIDRTALCGGEPSNVRLMALFRDSWIDVEASVTGFDASASLPSGTYALFADDDGSACR